MEENKIGAMEKEQAAPEEQTVDHTKEAADAQRAMQEKIQKTIEERRQKIAEATEALKAGKGCLKLETPIMAQDESITELAYDFTVMKGNEYTDAMDSDPNANNSFTITKRQALALFAKAAAKQSNGRLDMQDIIGGIGVTDSIEAVEIATLFFNASRRAGQMRISRLQ